MKSRCKGFLTHVVGTTVNQQLEPQNVSIVQEFLTIFLEDLLGLPPDQEIKFVIEVVSGMAPISKTPYCMAPGSTCTICEKEGRIATAMHRLSQIE